MSDNKKIEMITIPKGGRPKKIFTEELREELLRIDAEKGIEGIKETYGISRATAYRWLSSAKEDKE